MFFMKAFIKYGPITSYLWPFRAEELETALMEMAQHDNRRELSARVFPRHIYLTFLLKFFLDAHLKLSLVWYS